MPYILKEDRERSLKCPQTAGELNFAITKILLLEGLDPYDLRGRIEELITQFRIHYGETNYQMINDIVGALDCCYREYCRCSGKEQEELDDVYSILDSVKRDFYQFVAVPYECIKRAQNGDVF